MFRFDIWTEYTFREFKGAQKFVIKAADERSARRMLERKLTSHYGDGFKLNIRRIEKHDI